jgi:hypothetical protein
VGGAAQQRGSADARHDGLVDRPQDLAAFDQAASLLVRQDRERPVRFGIAAGEKALR